MQIRHSGTVWRAVFMEKPRHYNNPMSDFRALNDFIIVFANVLSLLVTSCDRGKHIINPEPAFHRVGKGI